MADTIIIALDTLVDTKKAQQYALESVFGKQTAIENLTASPENFNETAKRLSQQAAEDLSKQNDADGDVCNGGKTNASRAERKERKQLIEKTAEVITGFSATEREQLSARVRTLDEQTRQAEKTANATQKGSGDVVYDRRRQSLHLMSSAYVEFEKHCKDCPAPAAKGLDKFVKAQQAAGNSVCLVSTALPTKALKRVMASFGITANDNNILICGNEHLEQPTAGTKTVFQNAGGGLELTGDKQNNTAANFAELAGIKGEHTAKLLSNAERQIISRL